MPKSNTSAALSTCGVAPRQKKIAWESQIVMAGCFPVFCVFYLPTMAQIASLSFMFVLLSYDLCVGDRYIVLLFVCLASLTLARYRGWNAFEGFLPPAAYRMYISNVRRFLSFAAVAKKAFCSRSFILFTLRFLCWSQKQGCDDFDTTASLVLTNCNMKSALLKLCSPLRIIVGS